MEINSKQELTDYTLLCVPWVYIDTFAEVYMKDITMVMQDLQQTKVWG